MPAALTLLIGAVALVACSKPPADKSPSPPLPAASAPAEFVGSPACADCHASQYERWTGSHHQLAMQPATPGNVLGDFENAQFEYFGVTSRFFTRDGEFWVETDNADGELQEFPISYTFGVEPLQQYLVEFPGGHLQPLLIAWDSTPADAGGQRWFHLYPDEFIGSDDQLHWTGRSQNWNYMCAECHSTRLEKNYELKSDSFDTTWSEISVGCEACHGPASRHVVLAESESLQNGSGLTVDLNDAGAAAWQMNVDTGIAARSELRMSPQQQPEACGRCHSRRAVSSSDYAHGVPLLDTHRVSLLDELLYYPDGQIQEEVYVYGSFVQSKMYRAGVSCSDCHDPHAATLKTDGDVSDVCATCHLPTVFASTDHHQHPEADVQCVDCHMPSRIYMGNDPRRDHSFRVPRPDLTSSTGSPNACSGCHLDKDAGWADAALRDWYGDDRPAHYATAIHAGRTGAVGANNELSIAAMNADYPGIARATALSLLSPPHSSQDLAALEAGLKNGDSLIRVGALRGLAGFPPEAQLEAALPLLSDPVKSVRLEAVRLVSPVRGSLPQGLLDRFAAAEREYIDAQLAIAERPEALGNLGNLFMDAGNAERALQFYQVALQLEPRAVMIRVNMADLYRQLQRDENAEALLRDGLALPGEHASLHHSLGLLLVRNQRQEEALAALEQAALLEPDNARYTFVLAIALNSLGQEEAAIETLREASERFPSDFDIGWSLVTMLRDSGQPEDARREAVRLTERFPDNENAAALLQSLSAA